MHYGIALKLFPIGGENRSPERYQRKMDGREHRGEASARETLQSIAAPLEADARIAPASFGRRSLAPRWVRVRNAHAADVVVVVDVVSMEIERVGVRASDALISGTPLMFP